MTADYKVIPKITQYFICVENCGYVTLSRASTRPRLVDAEIPLTCYNILMKITDKVYGDFEISEPVLGELLISSELERLKKISQYGVPDKYHSKKNFSRYEHSVGVMLLLRLLGASLEEQVGGLLHDISHSSFSHVIDWIYGKGRNGKENFQDEIQSEFLQASSIPEVLSRFGLTISDVSHNPKHILLEQNLPHLCADRIDYTLRELKTDHPDLDITNIISSLQMGPTEIYFKSLPEVRTFGDDYLYLQKSNWGAELSRVRFALLADAFKRALKLGIVEKNDFWVKDEEELLKLLENSHDKQIDFCLTELASRESKLNRATRPSKKIRYVDPLVLIGKTYHRLSEIDSEFAEALERSIRVSGERITLPHY